MMCCDIKNLRTPSKLFIVSGKAKPEDSQRDALGNFCKKFREETFDPGT